MIKTIYVTDYSELNQKGFERMAEYFDIEISQEKDLADILVDLDHEQGLNGYRYEIKNKTIFITYSHTSSLYRALNFALNGEELVKQESRTFSKLSVSLDLSRNAVMKESALIQYTCRLASLGFDKLYLYMEDMYELENYPYFGYLRGRYSQEFLKEYDDIARSIGIELIPAIQTLSHLERPLKWHAFEEMKDTETSLKVKNNASYALIESMIQSMSECFTSDYIHLGLDEALHLGLGKYLEDNEYESKESLFLQHLEQVYDLAMKYGKKPIIWSDMFLRVHSKTGYYYDEAIEIEKGYLSDYPDLTIVYWDYYHKNKEDYDRLIDLHYNLTEQLFFAGGIWVFNGISPNYGRMITNTLPALQSCVDFDIPEVIATIWLDDGAETPIEASYLGLQLFADYQYNVDLTEEELADNFSKLQDYSYQDVMLLNQFDQTPGVGENNPYSSSLSKVILYQDILLGLYDKNIEGLEIEKHYQNLYQNLSEMPNKDNFFLYYEKLSEIMMIKSSLGLKIRQDYSNHNKRKMEKHLEDLTYLVSLYKELINLRKTLWRTNNKLLGWEVIERRIYGVIGRLYHAIEELSNYKENPAYRIEELEYSLLPFSHAYTEINRHVATNKYKEIISVNGV